MHPYTSTLRRRLYQWLLREPRTAQRASRPRAPDSEILPPALRDSLTQLPARVLLEDRVQQAIEHCRRRRMCCAVLHVELARVDALDDTLGPAAGNTLRRNIAERLRSALRLEDTVSRPGEDCFVVVLKQVRHAEDAPVLARKLVEILSRPLALDNHELRMGSSIGVALFPDHGDDGARLLAYAESAAGHAKTSGRSGVAVFERRMEDEAPP